jgi:nuclear transport factor 2 (NTF2) superfamily protein
MVLGWFDSNATASRRRDGASGSSRASSYGKENWEFTQQGLMARRYASISDLPIAAADRKFFWPLERRPDDHPSLGEFRP